MPNRQRFLRKEKPFLLFRLESWRVSNVPDDFSSWENPSSRGAKLNLRWELANFLKV